MSHTSPEAHAALPVCSLNIVLSLQLDCQLLEGRLSRGNMVCHAKNTVAWDPALGILIQWPKHQRALKALQVILMCGQAEKH